MTVNNTSNLAVSRQQLGRLGCSIAIRRPSDSSELSIDNMRRDRMEERRGEDILLKTEWMAKMDGDKRYKEPGVDQICVDQRLFWSLSLSTTTTIVDKS